MSHIFENQSFEAQMSFVKMTMAQEQYRDYDEGTRSRILEQRIKKFYSQGDRINVANEHYQPRKEPVYNPEVFPCQNVLYLFGIDFLKKKDLKQMFEEFEPKIDFVNESSCYLTFKDGNQARLAIKKNVKANSDTRMKIQERDEEQEGILISLSNRSNSEQSHPYYPPKGWIELKPYIYRHYYINPKDFPNQYQEYQRILHIRHATTAELDLSKNMNDVIQTLIQKCKKIWQNDAQKNRDLRNLIQQKICRLKRNQENRNKNGAQRSRSRQRYNKNEDNLDLILNKNSKKKVPAELDDELSMEIKSRSEAGELGILLEQFDKLNISFGPEKSVTSKGAEKNNSCSSSELSYKVCQPSLVSLSQGEFNYRKYIEETETHLKQIKKVQFIDLSD